MFMTEAEYAQREEDLDWCHEVDQEQLWMEQDAEAERDEAEWSALCDNPAAYYGVSRGT